jgi:repressor LexA
VRKQDTARSGEIVVALVGEEATVKTLRRAGRRVELHPANPDFSPIVPAPGEFRVSGFRILGRVIEVRRRLA